MTTVTRIFADNFTALDPSRSTRDTSYVRTYVRTWGQNDANWQNLEIGYPDFAAHTWNGNRYQQFGTTSSSLFSDTAPTVAFWPAWYNDPPVQSGSRLLVNGAIARDFQPASIVGSVTYTLTISADPSVANIQPFIRAHSSGVGSTYLTPNECVDSLNSNGPLVSKPNTGSQTWSVTFSGNRTHFDLRIVTAGTVAMTAVTLGGSSGTTAVDPFSIDTDGLVITATRTPTGLRPAIAQSMTDQQALGAGVVATTSDVPDWIGGVLITDLDHINPDTSLPTRFTGGWFRMRAKFDDLTPGMFPAWWLFSALESTEPNNKGRAEIDIFEIFAEATTPLTMYATLHKQITDGSLLPIDERVDVGNYSLDVTQWHLYEFEWQPHATPPKMVWYVDGVEKTRKEGADVAWFTDVEMAMRIDLVMDPRWITPLPSIGATTSPKFHVDYVDVWNQNPIVVDINNIAPTTSTSTVLVTGTVSPVITSVGVSVDGGVPYVATITGTAWSITLPAGLAPGDHTVTASVASPEWSSTASTTLSVANIEQPLVSVCAIPGDALICQ